MNRRRMTREDYAELATDELNRRLERAEDRISRAMTLNEDLRDGFQIQELQAALAERGEDF